MYSWYLDNKKSIMFRFTGIAPALTTSTTLYILFIQLGNTLLFTRKLKPTWSNSATVPSPAAQFINYIHGCFKCLCVVDIVGDNMFALFPLQQLIWNVRISEENKTVAEWGGRRVSRKRGWWWFWRWQRSGHHWWHQGLECFWVCWDEYTKLFYIQF